MHKRVKRVVIIGNYANDKQESMQRFALMLEAGYRSSGITANTFLPPAMLSYPFKNSIGGAGKWLGLADKWMLMPILFMFLRFKHLFNKQLFYHIADHSNAPYLTWLPKNKTLITCHDVLAIQGAMGNKEVMVEPSYTGRILQAWILRNLLKAKYLGAVSAYTLSQLHELALTNKSYPSHWSVVHNAFNAAFEPSSQTRISACFKDAGLDPGLSYLLHVGSAHARKNRALLVQMLIALGNDFEGKVVYAGEPIDTELLTFISDNNLNDRVININKPSHRLLVALYSNCTAFIFPSFSEGFGWPLIEAQACGAVVIASHHDPMPEIGGDGALYANPYDPKDFAAEFQKLQAPAFKALIQQKGFSNVMRFDMDNMIAGYTSLLYKMRKSESKLNKQATALPAKG